MNHEKPQPRPLPATMPEYVLVEILESEYRGAVQWKAHYQLSNKGREGDFIDMVVNFNRYQRPRDGERWWVKPTTMAPQKRLVFANADCLLDRHDKPLTVRTGDELFLPFNYSTQMGKYVSSLDGWTVYTRFALNSLEGENWRVRVSEFYLNWGMIIVQSIGPDPRNVYTPPKQVCYIGIMPLDEQRAAREGDVLTYWANDLTNVRGGRFSVGFEQGGVIYQFECSELRRTGERIIGLVTETKGRGGYLAEIVLIEGKPVCKPSNYSYRASPVEARIVDPDPDYDEEDIFQTIIDEERANGEPPDRGEY